MYHVIIHYNKWMSMANTCFLRRHSTCKPLLHLSHHVTITILLLGFPLRQKRAAFKAVICSLGQMPSTVTKTTSATHLQM